MTTEILAHIRAAHPDGCSRLSVPELRGLIMRLEDAANVFEEAVVLTEITARETVSYKDWMLDHTHSIDNAQGRIRYLFDLIERNEYVADVAGSNGHVSIEEACENVDLFKTQLGYLALAQLAGLVETGLVRFDESHRVRLTEQGLRTCL